MDIKAKINRWINGGWNYPSKETVKMINDEQIKKLQEQLAESRFQFNKLQSEYTTLTIMYAELKANPEIELDRIRDAYLDVEASYMELKRIVDDEYKGVYNRGFNDGRACAYDEFGLKLLAEGKEGTEEETISLEELGFTEVKDDIPGFEGTWEALDKLCEI